ncbi:hypothetical protein C1O24_03440 [Vibrio diazotrophicus]|nr:hypothetical protein C1O24_03440 [Vibrio diazotrophicus]
MKDKKIRSDILFLLVNANYRTFLIMVVRSDEILHTEYFANECSEVRKIREPHEKSFGLILQSATTQNDDRR